MGNRRKSSDGFKQTNKAIVFMKELGVPIEDIFDEIREKHAPEYRAFLDTNNRDNRYRKEIHARLIGDTVVDTARRIRDRGKTFIELFLDSFVDEPKHVYESITHKLTKTFCTATEILSYVFAKALFYESDGYKNIYDFLDRMKKDRDI